MSGGSVPDLFPYQKEGVEFLALNRSAFLADQPGLGKTPQAIVAMKKVATGNFNATICVICPRSAIENWRRELKRWWPKHDNPDDLITSYERITQEGPVKNQYLTTEFDFIIFDEGHRLKTPHALRTRAAYGRVVNLWANQSPVQRSTRVWVLSGTPAKNHAGEMFTHLAVLRPELIFDRSGRVMSLEQFEEKFCKVGFDPHGHRRIRGSKNIGELRKLLDESGFFLRRMKKDVQKFLPDLIMDDYPLPAPASVPGISGLEGMDWDEAATWLQENAGSLAEWRNTVAQIKTPIVKEYLETELDTPGEKIICFFHHRVMGAELHHLMAAYEPALVDGRTKDPQAEVDRFQNDPNCRLFLGQITACGEALNITAATQVAFAEAAWSPSDNYQAACRAHRIGLGHNLIVRFLSLSGSTDEIVMRVLQRKTAELAELFD